MVRDVVNYKSLPFNPKLKDRARELRKSGSLPEALLWKEIKNKKLNGLDFDRQKVIGNYIVDFFCASEYLVIEIDDAATHDNKGAYDAERDAYLKSLGLRVIHVSARDVLRDASAVATFIGTTPPLTGHPSAEGNFASSGDETSSPLWRGGTECRGGLVLSDRHIRDFVDYIRPGDVVVFNNSRVIPARFMASGHEITLHTAADDGAWWGLCKKFNKIPVGETLTLDDGTTATVLAHDDDSGIRLKFNTDNLMDVLDRVGKMPLPPYMKRDSEDADRDRYQTVYAGPLGSMAAPTAGLHFTPEILNEITARGAQIVNVTLHVGAGTWMPVKTEDLSQHKMHSEWCQITPDQADIINRATRVIAVGTTSMRTLESAAMRNREIGGVGRVAPFCGTTNIFITPGYTFGAVDVLLTNFHLPKSTLFMLVSAFAGVDEMRAAYAHAVAEKYRFFSYGDCCLLFKKDM
ncbi:tRNA preQ1(34) S-adenosylmethionine ribosyltransferase-isomerase QueA [bacterium]|nr:tRNA preQ1(34) S-adenosylmethionine ribosyltransferase-isomerase QueA [bacterium]